MNDRSMKSILGYIGFLLEVPNGEPNETHERYSESGPSNKCIVRKEPKGYGNLGVHSDSQVEKSQSGFRNRCHFRQTIHKDRQFSPSPPPLGLELTALVGIFGRAVHQCRRSDRLHPCKAVSFDSLHGQVTLEQEQVQFPSTSRRGRTRSSTRTRGGVRRSTTRGNTLGDSTRRRPAAACGSIRARSTTSGVLGRSTALSSRATTMCLAGILMSTSARRSTFPTTLARDGHISPRT